METKNQRTSAPMAYTYELAAPTKSDYTRCPKQSMEKTADASSSP
jgi:hypothetical protein